MMGNVEVCAILVHAGTKQELTVKDKAGNTPLQLASDKGHRQVARFLVCTISVLIVMNNLYVARNYMIPIVFKACILTDNKFVSFCICFLSYSFLLWIDNLYCIFVPFSPVQRKRLADIGKIEYAVRRWLKLVMLLFCFLRLSLVLFSSSIQFLKVKPNNCCSSFLKTFISIAMSDQVWCYVST